MENCLNDHKKISKQYTFLNKTFSTKKEKVSYVKNAYNTRDLDLNRKQHKVRFLEIDILRGLCIILVLIYHYAYFMCQLDSIFWNFFDVNNGVINWIYSTCKQLIVYDYTKYMYYLVVLFSGVFLVVTGISCSFSNNNLKRGLDIFITGALITFVTSILEFIFDFRYITIYCGILHCIGLSILIFCLINFVYKKLFNKEPGYFFFFVLCVIFLNIGFIFRKAPYFPTSSPTFWDIINIFIGTCEFGADFFPIFPNIGYVFFGIFIGKLLYEDRKKEFLPFLKNIAFKPFTFMGQHTLALYISELPVVISITIISMLFLGYNLNV